MGKLTVARSKIIQNVIIIALFIYFLVLCVSQQGTLDRNIEEYEALQKKTEQLSAENDELRKSIDKADDDEYLKQLIRAKLGYVEEGDIVFVEKNK